MPKNQYNQVKKGNKLSEFKPVKTEKSVISIRLDTELMKKIDKIATDTDISSNELILQCINYALKKM